MVAKNEVASLTLNCQRDYWHAGWKSGEVLRMAFTDKRLERHINGLVQHESQRLGVDQEAATALVYHNTARGLIELICTSARKLGYGALYGHEVDRHSKEGGVIAQPWLAVLSRGIISEPSWM